MRFVWISWQGRLTPELWSADAPAGCTANRVIVAERALSDIECGMTLDMLAKRYPAPKEVESA